MAYPDYSIVIIAVTENGVTTDYANAFYNEQLAQNFYNKAIGEGKRAFYFEKPQPSKFARNDAQPLKVNTEAGAENTPTQAMDAGEEQDLGEIAEEVYNSAEKTFTDAVGTIRTVQRFQVEVAKRYFDTFYVGPFKFFKKVFNRLVNEPAGTDVAIETITNKKITIKHDGNGFFTYSEEKLWPNKGEIEDSEPAPVYFQIEGNQVPAGTRVVRKTFGGRFAQDFEMEFVLTAIPEGLIIFETESTNYFSDGEGWYYSQPKEGGGGGGGNNNPSEGTNLGPDGSDPCYDRIANGSGGYTLQSNGSCNNPEAGTNLGVDPNNSCFDLIADGMGGSNQQSNGSCDNPTEGTNLGPDPSDPCFDRIANGMGGSTQQSNGSCDNPTAGTNLGPDPADPCYDLIADGNGGSTRVSNGSCDGGGGGDGGGGDGGGGGGGGEEGTEETIIDPEHDTNGQFSDYQIAANWDGGHPYNANGELHMVKLDPDGGIWVLDPAV